MPTRTKSSTRRATQAARTVLLALATQEVACHGGDAPPRAPVVPSDTAPRRAESTTAPVLVWARDKSGRSQSFRLSDADGEEVELSGGIVVAARGTSWRWKEVVSPVASRPCAGSPATSDPGRVTNVTLESGSQTLPVLGKDPTDGDLRDASEVVHEIHLAASLGPLLFLEEKTYVFACGAHGLTDARFVVFDVEKGAPLDLQTVLPRSEPLLQAGLEKLAQDGESKGQMGPPEITELLPVLTGGELVFEAQVTIPTCYACSDGLFGSYTRSVRLRTEPTRPLLARTNVPPSVLAFVRRHPEWTVGGWSSLER